MAAEEARRRSGVAVRDLALVAAPTMIDLGGGIQVPTWAYGPTVPGSEIRVKAGEVVRARFTNQLPEATTIHWHGISLRNDMDGVPGMTQDVVAPQGEDEERFPGQLLGSAGEEEQEPPDGLAVGFVADEERRLAVQAGVDTPAVRQQLVRGRDRDRHGYLAARLSAVRTAGGTASPDTEPGLPANGYSVPRNR